MVRLGTMGAQLHNEVCPIEEKLASSSRVQLFRNDIQCITTECCTYIIVEIYIGHCFIYLFIYFFLGGGGSKDCITAKVKGTMICCTYIIYV